MTLDARIVTVDPQGPDALMLLREAALEARALYPELQPQNAAWPINAPTPERGVYLVAYDGTIAVGIGALWPLDEGIAEIRRMYVGASHRHRGFGRRILAELERRAVDLGYAELRLETGARQQPAMRLYESFGFRRIEPFGSYVGDPFSICYEKSIGS